MREDVVNADLILQNPPNRDEVRKPLDHPFEYLVQIIGGYSVTLSGSELNYSEIIALATSRLVPVDRPDRILSDKNRAMMDTKEFRNTQLDKTQNISTQGSLPSENPMSFY